MRENVYLFRMKFNKIYQHDKQFLSITSLLPEEFDVLFAVFEPRWIQWYKHYDFRLQRRKKPLTARQMNAATQTLATNESKLFFVLYLYKVNPLQDVAAATFDMNQGQVSKWRKVLTPILLKSLEDLGVQAARNTEELVRLFRNQQRSRSNEDQSESLHLDATERPIERNLDYSTQKHDYSGKQGCHTAKNSIICDEYQFVYFLGYTWRGAIHDKAMIEQEIPNLSDSCFDQQWFSKDTGYQGYRPEGVHLLEPYKAARKHPLSDIQKEMNSWISSIRVVVENAIGGIKRLRAASETLRHFTTHKADQIINVAVGLHNLRVRLRKDTYTIATSCVRANLNSFRA